jgi:hypothetical protein
VPDNQAVMAVPTSPAGRRPRIGDRLAVARRRGPGGAAGLEAPVVSADAKLKEATRLGVEVQVFG